MAMNCTHCGKRLSRKSARLIDGVVMCGVCMFTPAKQRKTLAVIEMASADQTVGLGPQGESANSSEYFPNTPGTHTMTNTPNPGDQAVEAVARLLCGGSDPDELVEAGNPIGEPCDYPRWMLYQLDALKIIDTLGATCTRRESRFEAALREIESPIAAMQKRAEAEGGRLNGPIALSIANDPEYLKRIARTALELG